MELGEGFARTPSKTRTKLAPHIYIDTSYYRSQYPIDRFRLRALAHGVASRGVLVGLSAAAALNLPISSTTKKIQFAGTCTRSFKETENRYRIINGTLDIATPIGSAETTDYLSTCIDVTRWEGIVEGLIITDYCLSREAFSIEELRDEVHDCQHFSGSSILRELAALACPGSQSPQESILKYNLCDVVLDCGVSLGAQPELTVPGQPHTYASDLWIPEVGLLIEYDGQGKYSDTATQTTSSVILAELNRQKLLESLGFTFFRVTGDVVKNTDYLDHIRNLILMMQQYPRPFHSELAGGGFAIIEA